MTFWRNKPIAERSKNRIACLLGISRRHLYDTLAERKPVSSEVGVRLGKLFGNGSDLWIKMQAAYDEWQASRAVDVSNISTLHTTTSSHQNVRQWG